MTKADQWFHHQDIRVKRSIICDSYEDCCECPMFAFKDCGDVNETYEFFNKDMDKEESDEKTESSI